MRKFLPLLLLPTLMMPSAQAAEATPPITSGLVLYFNATQMVTSKAPAQGQWISTLSPAENESAGHPGPVLSGRVSSFNGMSVVSFYGSGPFYKAPLDIRRDGALGGNITVFALYNFRGVRGNSGVFGNDNDGWDRFFLAQLGTDKPCVSNALPDAFCLQVGGTPTGRHLVAVRYAQSGESSIFLDGVKTNFTDGSHATAAKTSFIIGADGDNSTFEGEIAEVLVYKRQLSDREIALVTRYLSSKYGYHF